MRIPLSREKFALIDDSDFALVTQHTWSALRVRDNFYAVRLNGCAYIYMHRMLMGFPPGEVDHRNMDGLDNRRANLRCASNSQNQANRGLQKNNKSGFKGVSWCEKRKHWRARIKVDYKEVWLGYFESPKEASLAYQIAAKQHFGEFARSS